jgi:hypothetical protein
LVYDLKVHATHPKEFFVSIRACKFFSMFQENHEKPITNPLVGLTSHDMIKTVKISSSRNNMRSDEN